MDRPVSTERMKGRARKAKARAKRAFDKRGLWMTYNQSIAEIFYPERADFTVKYSDFDERYEGLITTEPALMRRNLANNLGAMMRPRGQDWFKLAVATEEIRDDHAVRVWCEKATQVMRRVIYDSKSMYTKAMAESDHDYVAFGNAVISHTYNRDETAMLFKCIHLRDCAWEKNDEGVIDTMFRKMEMTLRQVKQLFGEDNLPKEWQRECRQGDDKLMGKKRIIQIVAPMDDDYDQEERSYSQVPQAKFRALYVPDEDHEICCLGEGFFKSFPFTIREWMSVSGEDYARSPCTSVALADGRTLNVAEEALLTGIERAVRPPKWAYAGSLLDDQIRLGGDEVTWVDDEWDRSDGDPINDMKVGDPRYGIEFNDRMAARLHRTFYQDLLELPDKEMTAYEVQERMEMYIRESAPIFEPMEAENAHLLDAVFERAMDKGAFGPMIMTEYGPQLEGLPDIMLGQKLEFEFETPLTKAREKLDAAVYDQLMAKVGAIIETQEPRLIGMIDNLDRDKIARKGLAGTIPAEWLLPPEQVEELRAQQAEQAQQEQNLQVGMEVGSEYLKAKPENLDRIQSQITGEEPPG